MLKAVSCEKLIETPLTFKAGLNSVVGANDAHNSIGKSSILMLIDFAFGGSDFPAKCDDVIKNVGNFKVGIEFEFEKVYSFVRDTESPEKIYRVGVQDYISIREFNEFLKAKYLPDSEEISFRECVSGFFRIYQRSNYNDKRPLDIIPKDNWDSIRKRTLKIFGKYWTISKLEKEKTSEAKRDQDIKGTFNTGAIKKINKTQFKENASKLLVTQSKIESIKDALKNNVTDIKSIINDRNIGLKKEKDSLVESKFDLETKLLRIETNLSGSKVRNSMSFKSVVEYFPEIDTNKLSQVEGFHKGITKILKKQLQSEKISLLENIEVADDELLKIDNKLLEIVNSKEESVYLLEGLMELDRLRRDLSQQNDYWNRSDESKNAIRNLKESINNALVDSVNEIEGILNSGMKSYIKRIYKENPIAPQITLGKTDYKFDHGDDRGTGKGFANMIALDLTFLDKTHLPCLIHDSLLFKNIDVPAVENLISIYGTFKKQIFISIDEKSKYNESIQSQIQDSMFLRLGQDRVAFKLKWKNKGEQSQ